MQEEALQNTQDETAKKITAIMIANPKAGSYAQNREQIESTITYLNNFGWQAELKLTEQAGDGRKFAQEAVKQKLDVVVAVGGDGTINEIIQELAKSETALAVLPGGTVNVWAREMGIPLENEGAREILVNGRTRRIDLGKVNERYFLLMAAIGLDAEIIHAVEKKPLKRFGIFSYIFVTARLGFGYPNFQVILQMGDRVVRARAIQVIFGNTQLYAGAIKLTCRAKCDDGLLDICLVRSRDAFGRAAILMDFLLRRKQREQWVRYESVDEVKVHTNRPIAIQVDGDPAGYTDKKGFPATSISIIPGALKVIVPQEVSEDLFTQK